MFQSYDTGRVHSPMFGAICRRQAPRILFTYALFMLENILRLAHPWILGIAIDGLLRGSTLSLTPFIAQQAFYLSIRAFRQAYDTRSYTRIYTDLATELIIHQRRWGVSLSQIAARSRLIRDGVEFVETSIPTSLQCICSLVGGLTMLAFYDLTLAFAAIGTGLPAALLTVACSRCSSSVNCQLHDEMEAELEMITANCENTVRGYFERLGRCRIKLSDYEAGNFAGLDMLSLCLQGIALLFGCSVLGATAGDVFAVFRYCLLFASGIEGLPVLIVRCVRLRDIANRMVV